METETPVISDTVAGDAPPLKSFSQTGHTRLLLPFLNIVPAIFWNTSTQSSVIHVEPVLLIRSGVMFLCMIQTSWHRCDCFLREKIEEHRRTSTILTLNKSRRLDGGRMDGTNWLCLMWNQIYILYFLYPTSFVLKSNQTVNESQREAHNEEDLLLHSLRQSCESFWQPIAIDSLDDMRWNQGRVYHLLSLLRCRLSLWWSLCDVVNCWVGGASDDILLDAFFPIIQRVTLKLSLFFFGMFVRQNKHVEMITGAFENLHQTNFILYRVVYFKLLIKIEH